MSVALLHLKKPHGIIRASIKTEESIHVQETEKKENNCTKTKSRRPQTGDEQHGPGSGRFGVLFFREEKRKNGEEIPSGEPLSNGKKNGREETLPIQTLKRDPGKA